MTLVPGPTLSDSKGAKRIRKLEDSVLNLQMQVLEKLDCIAVMEHEIKAMREDLRKGKNTY